MAAFPNYAQILFEGYQKARESALMRTDMESGPPKQARVKSNVMEVHTVKIYLGSRADFQSFESWYANDIADGASWFDFTDPISNTTKQARFRDGGYTAQPMTAEMENWEVSAKIEIWSV